MLLFFLFFTLSVLAVELYAYQALKVTTRKGPFRWLYWSFTAIGYGIFVTQLILFLIGAKYRGLIGISFASFITLAIAKWLIILLLFVEDVFRLLKAVRRKIGSNKSEGNFLPSRKKFISQLALGLTAIPFASVLYGVLRGRYDFRVVRHSLYFDDLPKSFDGYQITHISDLHMGTFDDREKVIYAIDLIQNQQSDIILFTGDLVNNESKEVLPWQNILSRLSAVDGVYSVLGNHDYSDYKRWESAEAKQADFENLVGLQKEMGFSLLRNEAVTLNRNDDQLSLVGVENWGDRFVKKGDLELAQQNVHPKSFKILMSHDPSHWDQIVKDHQMHYHLTLSGHTHGMQFGVEIPGWIKWSPIQARYKYWAGIYQENGRYINVNRGLGCLGFPGRIGIWPEITVITLKKGVKSS
jgi:predicted MPP superfamily phosphohydrolase